MSCFILQKYQTSTSLNKLSQIFERVFLLCHLLYKEFLMSFFQQEVPRSQFSVTGNTETISVNEIPSTQICEAVILKSMS